VWFCKHLKYCGSDSELALALVGPDEPPSEPDDELTGGGVRKYTRRGGENYYRDSADRLRITGNIEEFMELISG
jgi:hypothetical protein